MNLATDEWLPVVRMDGTPDLVSLEQAFDEADRIRDLAVRPPERIALMRLLLAVAHAELNGPNVSGPENDRDWRGCRERISPAAVKHLTANRPSFELLGNGRRFGQVKRLVPEANENDFTDEALPKLNFALASGNNTTLFDNGGASSLTRGFSDNSSDAGSRQGQVELGDVAVWLLTFQCFAPPGGQGYKGKTPCGDMNMLHAFLLGSNLLESIWLNLFTKEDAASLPGCSGWGTPTWLLHNGWNRDASHLSGYLTRLVPLSKGIWLAEDGCSVRIERKGPKYPSLKEGGFREPCAALCADQKERWLLSADSHKAIWRELPAIMTRRAFDRDERLAPYAVQRFGDDRRVDLWVGSLIVVNTAKIQNTIESVFPMPVGSFSDDFASYYRGGVQWADEWEAAIKKGLSVYRRSLGDNLDRKQAAKRRRLMQQQAASHFWTAIEAGARDILIPLSAQPPDELKSSSSFKLDYRRSESRWGPIVRRAALNAYDLACPKGSARQAAAYGKGRNSLLQEAGYRAAKAGLKRESTDVQPTH